MLQHGQKKRHLDGSASDKAAATATQTVMIVNGCVGVLELIETILAGGRYDVVFVESNERAYSQVKRVQPDLVILCVRIDDVNGCQVLSMLRLDEKTREIPVLTHTTPPDAEEMEDAAQEPLDTVVFAPKRAELMN